MNDVERMLADLNEVPPLELEGRTIFEAGAADLVARIDSPFGLLWIAWSKRGITALTPTFASRTIGEFAEHHRRISYRAQAIPRLMAAEIEDALETGDSSALAFDLTGLTGFQRSVLEVCATIRPGTVRPYGWIAQEVRRSGAARAVGTALARNPIPLLIPCHRVVRSDGSVGSYAFGSAMKRELLERENAPLPLSQS